MPAFLKARDGSTAIVAMISGNDPPAAGVYVCVFICLYA